MIVKIYIEGELMKRLVLTVLLAGSSLFAQNGAEVFQAKCIICHKVIDVKARQAKMKSLPPKERKKAMMQFVSTLKAPPINKVSARIKHFHPKKADFVAFVKNYITHPDAKKALCMPMALKKFGTMPPIGVSMSEAQKDAVASWLYDNFKEKWSEMKACAADKGKGGMKCGAGKCGGVSRKPAMKCGAGKCGSM